MDTIAIVLATARKKGVRFWIDNGQMQYRAPRGALNQADIERLRESKEQIIAILENETQAGNGDRTLDSVPRLDRAPLTFSQLAHWQFYRLSERPGVRQTASALRLLGRLNVEVLGSRLAAIVRRHDALRTRIVVVDGVPVQEITKQSYSELIVSDITALSETLREMEISRTIEQLILEPIDISVGPLFVSQLLRLQEDEHVLIVAMEHIISDMFSMNIFLRELFTEYIQALKGNITCLPPIRVQFADYAVWQRNALQSWLYRHGAYWSQRMRGYQRLRFPEDGSVRGGSEFGWRTVPIRIGRSMTAELRKWSRTRRTTLPISILTAYVGLLLRWCTASASVIQYQSDGRNAHELENTIGFFASMLYLKIDLLDGDTFVDLTTRLATEYCEAYEHADFSYIAAHAPHREFLRNSVFNWIPRGSSFDLSELDGSEYEVTCSQIPFEHPMLKNLQLDHEPTILLFETDDEIAGDMYFPVNRFSVATMQKFGRNFQVFIESLLRQPDKRVKSIPLVQ